MSNMVLSMTFCCIPSELWLSAKVVPDISTRILPEVHIYLIKE